jgi:hypothetical protein
MVPGAFTFFVLGFGDSRCSGGATPLFFDVLVAEMSKWLPGSFYIFTLRVSGFRNAVEERDPLSLKSR